MADDQGTAQETAQEAANVVEEGTDYALLKLGEGSYRLVFKAENSTAIIEGDDATRFDSDYAEIKSQFPEFNADQTLAQLWDQGGYSWLAAPPEE